MGRGDERTARGRVNSPDAEAEMPEMLPCRTRGQVACGEKEAIDAGLRFEGRWYARRRSRGVVMQRCAAAG